MITVRFKGDPLRMSTVYLRPTFSVPTSLDASEVFSRIRLTLEEEPCNLVGQCAANHAMLSISDSKRHFWSPWLHLEVRRGDSGSEVFGRFSPHPSIWTGFMFSFLVLAVLVFFCGILAVSQRIAGQPAWGIWLIPVWSVIGLGLWVASRIGQNLAWNEMNSMRDLITRCVEI